MSTVDIDLKEFNCAKTRRQPWDKQFELIARYVLSRKQGFDNPTTNGDFLQHGDVYDSTAVRALNTMASSILGAVWKNGARTFRLARPDNIPETEQVKQFYIKANTKMVYHMEHPQAGLDLALTEYMLEEGAFGTAGIGIFPGKGDVKLEFKSWGLKNLYIIEDASGFVNGAFYVYERTAPQLVEEFGLDVLPDAVKTKYAANDYSTMFQVLWIIRPRKNYNIKIQNVLNMPYESKHILINEKVLLKESGFKEMPIKVSRMFKNQNEEYGRSPAMDALPDIIELNSIWEMLHKAAELSLFPAVWFMDDGTFGNGIIDRSPNAVNVLEGSSRITNQAPFGTIAEVKEFNSTTRLVETLVNQIMSHFYVDRLLDLNNQTRMTLGEAQIRNELRSESVGSIYNRQITELLTPLIQRSFNILFDAGELGVVAGSPQHKAMFATGASDILLIPDEIVQAMMVGQDIYKIQYISPAARILRSEELRGITSTWQFAASFAQVAPEMLIRLNKDKSIKLVGELTGAPDEIILSDEIFAKEMQAFRDAQNARAQLEAQAKQADANVKEASAAQQGAQAQATMAGSMLI